MNIDSNWIDEKINFFESWVTDGERDNAIDLLEKYQAIEGEENE